METKNTNISDVKKNIELMLENEKRISRGLAIEKLCVYNNDTYSFSRCGKQNQLDKSNNKVSVLEEVLKNCF